MEAVKFVGLFFVWTVVLILASISWFAWSIQRCVYIAVNYLDKKFFQDSRHTPTSLL